MPPVSGVTIQDEKSVESWAELVELRPHGSKFKEVLIQSYNGTYMYMRRRLEVFGLMLKFLAINIWQ